MKNKSLKIILISLMCLVVLSLGIFAGCSSKKSTKKSMDELDPYDNIVDGSGLGVEDGD